LVYLSLETLLGLTQNSEQGMASERTCALSAQVSE